MKKLFLAGCVGITLGLASVTVISHDSFATTTIAEQAVLQEGVLKQQFTFDLALTATTEGKAQLTWQNGGQTHTTNADYQVGKLTGKVAFTQVGTWRLTKVVIGEETLTDLPDLSYQIWHSFAPTLTIANQTRYQGQSDYLTKVKAVDYDGTPLSFKETSKKPDVKKAGVYTITISAKGKRETITKSFQLTIKSALTLNVKNITLMEGDRFDPKQAVTKATDALEGNLAVTTSSLNTKKTGTYTVTYTIKNKRGIQLAKKATVTVKAYDTVKSTQNLKWDGVIKNGSYTVFSRVENTKGAKAVKKASTVKGDIKITKKAVTSKNRTYYYIANHGWLEAKAVNVYNGIRSQKTLKWDAKVVKKNYNLYSKPWNTKGYKKLRSLNGYYQKDIKIIKRATTKRGTYYQIKSGNKTLGWVDHRAFSVYNGIRSQKKVNYSAQVRSKGRGLYSKPWNVKGYKKITKMSKYYHKHVTVVKEATTIKGKYYQLKYNGKIIGWADHRTFDQKQIKYRKVEDMLRKKYKGTNLGVYVQPVNGGYAASHNGKKTFVSASSGKLPVIWKTQKLINQGKLKPNKKIKYTHKINKIPHAYSRWGTGRLQSEAWEGRQYTADTILKYTIVHSDNQGTNMLAYYFANKNSDGFIREIEDIVGHKLNDFPFRMSAKDLTLIMREVYKEGGNAVKYLKKTEWDNVWIPRDLPVPVAHKIGFVDSYSNDVAIVYAKEPYVLTIMTNGRANVSNEISKISKDVYNILK